MEEQSLLIGLSQLGIVFAGLIMTNFPAAIGSLSLFNVS